MLTKSNVIGSLLKSYASQGRRCVASISSRKKRFSKEQRLLPQEEANVLDVSNTQTTQFPKVISVVKRSRMDGRVSVTPLTDHQLQNIHETEVAHSEDSMIAHSEYANYCRKNPQNILRVDNQYEMLNLLLCPLLKITDYYGQLMIKKERAILPFVGLTKSLQKANCILHTTGKGQAYPCKIEHMRHMELKPEYRNSSELVVSTGVDGEYNTVGYLVPDLETKESLCVNPIHHPDTKKSHKIVAMFFQDFIQNNFVELNAAPWRIWKGLSIRSTEAHGDHMAIVKMAFCIPPKQRAAIKEALCHLFFLGDLKSYCNISSLYVQFGESIDSRELLKGKPCLIEQVNRVNYELGPSSSFPANSCTTDLLIGAIRDAYKFDIKTVALQMGCHSNFAMHVKKVRNVVCFEWRDHFLRAGKRHAEINNLRNIDFVFCKDIKNLNESLDDPNANYVAVVHSINGFNKEVLYCLRRNLSVKAVVYIFHSFVHTKADLMPLCSNYVSSWHPLSQEGLAPERFVPSKIVPIDMLPNTLNAEYVMTLQRESAVRRKRHDVTEKDFYAFNQKYRRHEVYDSPPALDVDHLDGELDLR